MTTSLTTALHSPKRLAIEALPDLVLGLDSWIALQPDPKPAREDALLFAIRDWLTGLGLLDHLDDPATAN